MEVTSSPKRMNHGYNFVSDDDKDILTVVYKTATFQTDLSLMKSLCKGMHLTDYYKSSGSADEKSPEPYVITSDLGADVIDVREFLSMVHRPFSTYRTLTQLGDSLMLSTCISLYKIASFLGYEDLINVLTTQIREYQLTHKSKQLTSSEAHICCGFLNQLLPSTQTKPSILYCTILAFVLPCFIAPKLPRRPVKWEKQSLYEILDKRVACHILFLLSQMESRADERPFQNPFTLQEFLLGSEACSSASSQ